MVQFGTSGWRGIIAEDFTFGNVRIAVAAIAGWALQTAIPRSKTASPIIPLMVPAA